MSDNTDPTAEEVIEQAVSRIAEESYTTINPAADAIIVALTDAGYRIVRDDAAGMVRNDGYTEAQMEAVYRAVMDLAEHLGHPARWFQDAIDTALIAAAAPDTGEEAE